LGNSHVDAVDLVLELEEEERLEEEEVVGLGAPPVEAVFFSKHVAEVVHTMQSNPLSTTTGQCGISLST
jgi:hypothetical protein